jgi:hypothetical protein
MRREAAEERRSREKKPGAFRVLVNFSLREQFGDFIFLRVNRWHRSCAEACCEFSRERTCTKDESSAAADRRDRSTSIE